MSKSRALILSGDGINCEIETAAAARDAGFETTVVHVNDLLESKARELAETKLFVLPGGFSFGDELGSGKILALKLKHGLGDALTKFISRGGAVLGICNGFQVLTRVGVFGESAVLAQNAQGHFVDRWVELELGGRSIFTESLRDQGVSRIELPIRHGEGRLLFARESDAQAIEKNGQIALSYTSDINGAWKQVAGLSAHSGRVLGLMPHPEAFWSEELHPNPRAKMPLGVEFFRSAYKQLR